MKKSILFISVFVMLCLFAGNAYAQAASGKKPTAPNKWSKTVVLETNQGVIEIKLLGEIAPKACENFVSLVRKGYYNGLIFHRVIKDFMIQGGDPTGTGRGGQSIWGRPFEDECVGDVSFDSVGLLAMANAGPGTNGSQFFITTNVGHTRHLHMKHTIFGKVVGGMDVVRKIENCQTDRSNKPLKDQKIIKAYIKGDKK